MATLDRIDPTYTPWTPSSAGMATLPDTAADTPPAYVGRHRRADERRRLSLGAMFYTARHRAR